jgi:hypothetical protein
MKRFFVTGRKGGRVLDARATVANRLRQLEKLISFGSFNPKATSTRHVWRRKEKGGVGRADRIALCKEYGVRNTGRQFRRLRKRLQRAVRWAGRSKAV